MSSGSDLLRRPPFSTRFGTPLRPRDGRARSSPLVIGGLIAYGLALCLAPYIASVEADPGSRPAERIDPALLDRIEVRLVRAFVACGAIAGFVCAVAANLLGLTMRPELAPAARLHPPGEGA